MNWKDIPVPELMADLPRDKRGYPIPFIVAEDNAGEPLFTVNDDRKTLFCISEMRCGICGNELIVGDMWWVGGAISAFHPQGAYVDGPMHYDCSAFALQTCPYLAAPSYRKRIDGLPANKNGIPFSLAMDPTMMPERPNVFVQGRSASYSVTWPLTPDRKLFPVSGIRMETGEPVRWLDYEVWREGETLTEEEGIAEIRSALETMNQQRTQRPRLFVPDQPGLIV